MDMTTRIQAAVIRADLAIMAVLLNLPSIVLGLVLIWFICKIAKGVFHGIESRRSN
jgi:ABC-type phosphate transport system permease subunit